MFRKFISLFLAFIIFLSGNIYAGGPVSAEDIKLMISTPEKYSKDEGMLLSMAVMAGLPSYDAIIKTVTGLKKDLAAKELLLEEMQNARIFEAGKAVNIPVKKYTDLKMNFQAFDNYYKWQKENVYLPAFEEVKKYRLAYMDFYKSPEIKASWEAAEKAFAATEKEFKALERQWNTLRNNLLKTSTVSAQESALKKEIAALRKSLTSKQSAFMDAQYRVFMEEYEALLIKIRSKTGLFMPKELEKFVNRLDIALRRFQKATTEEDLNFARKALKEVLQKFRNISPGVNPKEVKFYKESLNKFFSNMSKRLNLKSSVPLLAVSGIAIFMFSAQSAYSAEISNRNIIVARTLEQSYKEMPELLLANVLSLSKYYGIEAVSNVLYEDQKYLPLLTGQLEALKYIGEHTAKEQSIVSDIVINSSDYTIPFKNFSFQN